MGGSGDKKSMSAAHGTSFLVHLVNGQFLHGQGTRQRDYVEQLGSDIQT